MKTSFFKKKEIKFLILILCVLCINSRLLDIKANDNGPVSNGSVTQSLIDLGLVSSNGCDGIGDPYIFDGECTIGINRYISRAANMAKLSRLNTKESCWGYLPLDANGLLPPHDAEVNCNPPYDLCWSRYCPTKYAEQIDMLKELKIAFVARAASAWGREHGFKPGGANFIAAQQVIVDINETYDCAGLRRPIIQAGIFEGVSGNIDSLTIPTELIEEFADEMGPEDHAYYIGADNVPNELNFRKSRMLNGHDRHVDITSYDTRMWYLYQARHYIDMGYKAIHMGIFWAVAKNDEGFPIYYDVLTRIREYAGDRLLLLNGENQSGMGSAKLAGTDNLLFDFDGIAMRPREVANPSVAADSPGQICDDPIDESVFEASPCEEEEYLAIIDECGISQAVVAPDGDNSGISPMGCHYENVPYFVYYDFANGAVPDSVDCGNDEDALYVASSGDETWNGGSNLTWGFDDARWFSEILTPECRTWWWDHYYCERRDFHGGTGFIQIPGMLITKHRENYCDMTTLPNADGMFMLSDHPELLEAISNTLEPNNTSIFINEGCDWNATWLPSCEGDNAPTGWHYQVSKKYYEFSTLNPDCSSTYSIHVKDPYGNWLPQTIGKYKKVYPPFSGTYTIYLRQDNLGLESSIYGSRTVEQQEYLEVNCCNGPFRDDRDPRDPKNPKDPNIPFVVNDNDSEEQESLQFRNNSSADLVENEIICYPNPTRNSVVVSTQQESVMTEVIIYNSVGIIIEHFKQPNKRIEVNFNELSIAKGLYYIEGTVNGKKYYTSVVYQ